MSTMAAGSFCEDFVPPIKIRKRGYDSLDEQYDSDSKRRNLQQTQTRTPSTTCHQTSTSATKTVPPTTFGLMTPDSLLERREWLQPPCELSPSRSQSDNFGSSLRLRTACDHNRSDTVSTTDNISPLQPRIGRARSNDLMSPARAATAPSPFLCDLPPRPRLPSLAADRVPTPLTATFPGSPFRSTFSSSTNLRLQTSLTPMIDAESWTPQTRRPDFLSGELDTAFEEDATMIGSDDMCMSSSFGNLSVNSHEIEPAMANLHSMLPNGTYSSSSQAEVRQELLQQSEDGMDMEMDDVLVQKSLVKESDGARASGQANGRTARLHMGFKADCEKCLARVPGHYSHILWS